DRAVELDRTVVVRLQPAADPSVDRPQSLRGTQAVGRRGAVAPGIYPHVRTPDTAAAGAGVHAVARGGDGVLADEPAATAEAAASLVERDEGRRPRGIRRRRVDA